MACVIQTDQFCRCVIFSGFQIVQVHVSWCFVGDDAFLTAEMGLKMFKWLYFIYLYSRHHSIDRSLISLRMWQHKPKFIAFHQFKQNQSWRTVLRHHPIKNSLQYLYSRHTNACLRPERYLYRWWLPIAATWECSAQSLATNWPAGSLVSGLRALNDAINLIKILFASTYWGGPSGRWCRLCCFVSENWESVNESVVDNVKNAQLNVRKVTGELKWCW